MKGVQSFLGLVNFYRRFITNHSNLSGPLLHLLGKQVPFKWTAECNNSFKKLKEALTASSVLIMPDFNETFYLNTDASNIKGTQTSTMQHRS